MADLEKRADGSFCVNVGGEELTIRKLYGPTIFADFTVRATFVGDDAYWLVLRDGKEFCRIPAQLEGDFEDDADTGDGEE